MTARRAVKTAKWGNKSCSGRDLEGSFFFKSPAEYNTLSQFISPNCQQNSPAPLSTSPSFSSPASQKPAGIQRHHHRHRHLHHHLGWILGLSFSRVLLWVRILVQFSWVSSSTILGLSYSGISGLSLSSLRHFEFQPLSPLVLCSPSVVLLLFLYLFCVLFHTLFVIVLIYLCPNLLYLTFCILISL